MWSLDFYIPVIIYLFFKSHLFQPQFYGLWWRLTLPFKRNWFCYGELSNNSNEWSKKYQLQFFFKISSFFDKLHLPQLIDAIRNELQLWLTGDIIFSYIFMSVKHQTNDYTIQYIHSSRKSLILIFIYFSHLVFISTSFRRRMRMNHLSMRNLWVQRWPCGTKRKTKTLLPWF